MGAVASAEFSRQRNSSKILRHAGDPRNEGNVSARFMNWERIQKLGTAELYEIVLTCASGGWHPLQHPVKP